MKVGGRHATGIIKPSRCKEHRESQRPAGASPMVLVEDDGPAMTELFLVRLVAQGRKIIASLPAMKSRRKNSL